MPKWPGNTGVANYGTIGGCYNRFPAIGSVSTITSNVVFTYLNGVEARLESRISHFYSTYFPLSVDSNPVLREIAETWVCALLLRRFYTQEKSDKSDWVKDWFDDVDAMLEPLISGSATLAPLTPGGTIDQPWSNTMNYFTTFDVDDPIDQYADSNRLTDIRNTRLRGK